MGSLAPSAPETPDYTGAAIAEGEAGKENIAAQTYANRVDQFNPWGNTTYESYNDYDESTDQDVTRWRQYETLNPELQGALDAEVVLQRGRSELGASKMGQLSDDLGGAMDWSQFGNQTELELDSGHLRDKAEYTAYNKSLSRLDPQFDQDENDMEVKLRGQGLTPGDEAYDRAMGNFGRAKNDAYAGAWQDAVAQGRSESALDYQQQMGQADYANTLRNDAIQEEINMRAQNLNETTAIINGQQVQSPTMSRYNSAGAAPPTDFTGAASGQGQADANKFSAQQAGSQGMLAGLGTIASAIPWSDRRLKMNISFIGDWLGQRWYSWTYLWGARGFGVMADEINQDAVFTQPNGFDMVDYSRINYDG